MREEDSKMAQSRYDLILHPVRLRILHALEGDRRMTVRQLEQRLGDVPLQTLAGHIHILVDGGMLLEEGEGPEPLYHVGETTIPDYEKHRATPADHLRYFTTFVAGLISSFSQYTKRRDADVVRDHIAYRQRTLFLTDQELADLLDDIERRLDQEEDDPTNPDRTPRVVSWIVLPEIKPGEEGTPAAS